MTVGRHMGRCVLYEAFAFGGMAHVHYGRLITPGEPPRVVAVKRVGEHVGDRAKGLRALEKEGRLVGRLVHRNLAERLDQLGKIDSKREYPTYHCGWAAIYTERPN